jgi:hypothetical protein
MNPMRSLCLTCHWQKFTLLILLFIVGSHSYGTDKHSYIRFTKEHNSFPLAENGVPVPMIISSSDHAGVLLAAEDLRSDFERVTGKMPGLVDRKIKDVPFVVIAGTLGRHALIDELVKKKKIDVSSIIGKWEGFIMTVVDNPTRGIGRALVIVGSDKRGTIFGLYDLAQQIGVSPWAWWADVPVRKHENIYFVNETQVKIPAVKYRGIFINDEQPALGGWVAQNYGSFNHRFYERVFELILRMKGNFLWPAMWGQSFYSEDSANPKLADEMGVVIGTSHHEPMMRAHAEWQKNGGGAWNYNTNSGKLRKYWKEGVTRMGTYESIVTLAMRGDGDEPMSEESNVKLLQQIVEDQRKILQEVTGKPANATPQVWALYKEVQDYYDKGMRVPDDVTLLLCDDNWGNLRKLPDLRQKPHPGGYGIYYHFDYVGDPRNYKWINTNQITRVWEQMHLAWEYGAHEIWIVNVGDIKPMEFPIEFFLDYAFDPTWNESELDEYTRLWAGREFGEYGDEVAGLISKYTFFNARRKPELLAPDSFSPGLYSLVNYGEAEGVVREYNELATKAESLYQKLPAEYRDAFYQLVLYPVKASANINEMYYAVRLNHLYASQQRSMTDDMAEKARHLFQNDSILARYYNKTMSGGKWDHFMDQLRIGYKGWHDDFKVNTLPELKTYTPMASGKIGIAIEGSEESWPKAHTSAQLPTLDPYVNKEVYFEIFNRGTQPFYFSTESSPGLILSSARGTIADQQRISITVDWTKLTDGVHTLSTVVKSSDGERIVLTVPVSKFESNQNGFLESDGYVSIEAAHFTGKTEHDFDWKILPGHGRTLSGVTAYPVTASSDSLTDFIEYDIYFSSTGRFNVHTYFSPTIDFTGGDGLKFAVSFDNEKPVTVNMHAKNSHRDWQESVKDNIRIVTSEVEIKTPGKHVLKFWRVDPGVVLQKIVIDTGGLRPSYLGPPETELKIEKVEN